MAIIMNILGHKDSSRSSILKNPLPGPNYYCTIGNTNRIKESPLAYYQDDFMEYLKDIQQQGESTMQQNTFVKRLESEIMMVNWISAIYHPQ
jgi:hypothetical protein